MRHYVLILCLTIGFAPIGQAAFNVTTTWDIQTGGNDDNGGGWDTASTGTDYSQTTTPHVIFDGTTITASNASASPTITITGYTVDNGDVGNVLKITTTGSGTFLINRYRIVSVNTAANTWTLDRNVTSAAGSGMTGRMGGCLGTLTELVTVYPSAAGGVADMPSYIKTGTYAALGATVFAAVTGTNSNRLIGYNIVHGDGPIGTDRPVIQFNTGGGGNGVSVTNGTGGWIFEYLDFDGAGTNTVLLNFGTTVSQLIRSKVHNTTGTCVTGSTTIVKNEFTACSGSTTLTLATTALVINNWFHDNTNSTAVISAVGGSPVLFGNLITNNSNIGVRAVVPALIVNNTIYKQTTASISVQSVNPAGVIMNNALACSGTYDIDFSGQPTAGNILIDYNGHHAPTTGTVRYLGNGAHDVQIGAIGSACATNNPFYSPVNSGAGDFSLNSLATAGFLWRNVGTTGPPSQTTTASPQDIGVYFHKTNAVGIMGVQ